jgi:hypothetical protein
MSLKNLFSEEVQKILTEDSLNAIQEAVNSKVELAVSTALEEQDTLYAEKLGTLISTIDKDHTKKMIRLVEAVDKNNASKLVKIVKLYERANKSDAKKFQKQMLQTVSAYLDTFLEESIKPEDIAQAVKNKSAYNILSNLRNVLGVDTALMNPSIKEAVLDAKSQIDTLATENTELKTKLDKLTEAYEKVEVKAVLEEKTSKLPEAKKNFIKKALGDKSVKFIEENFDYTLRLFDRNEKQKLSTLKEEAINNRTVKPDIVPPQKVVEEKVNNTSDGSEMYLTELSKAWPKTKR